MTKHTEIAAQLFPISGETVNSEILRSLILIKKGAAEAHANLEVLETDKAQKIKAACAEVLALDKQEFIALFPIDVFQTGSGTNSNMNVNEIIAERADVHPNNDVNYGQSSNDTFPSAIYIAAQHQIIHQLLPAVEALIKTTSKKAEQLKNIVKTGRTHSMDAMPITFDQEINAWVQALADSLEAIKDSLKPLSQIPLGGTAVGTGINAHPKAAQAIADIIAKDLNISVTASDIPASRMGSQHTLLHTSNSLTTLATVINKIASDLILLNSGPFCGFGDIQLPSHIDGSSIMPGKVNPVIPESACQVYARVMGNHTTITCGTSNSRLQLNVYLPVMGNALLSSIEVLTNTCQNLQKDLKNFTVNDEKIAETMSRNPILITGLNKKIGYDKGKLIVQKALAKKRPLIEVAEEMTDLSQAELETALDPLKLTQNH